MGETKGVYVHHHRTGVGAYTDGHALIEDVRLPWDGLST